MNEIRLAVIEDDEDIRPALQMLINGSPGFVCQHAYASVEEGLEKIPLKEIDIILLDIHLPGMDGIAGVGAFKTKRPDLLIMMFTIYDDDEHVFNALKAGADGYVLKRSTPVELLALLTELQQGGAPMSPEIARRVVQSFKQQELASTDSKTEEAPDLSHLTPREQEVLQELALGYYYKEIAHRLHISLDTVKRHITHIYQKLHVQNRTEALNKAFPRS
jgi:DNA-binding NarL/FixJ family response regulator